MRHFCVIKEDQGACPPDGPVLYITRPLRVLLEMASSRYTLRCSPLYSFRVRIAFASRDISQIAHAAIGYIFANTELS